MMTRDQLKSIYEKALADDNHHASEDVQTADDKHSTALMDYIVAIQEDTFCWAYELGYQAGQAVPERQENIQTIDFINRMLRGFDARRLNLVYHLCLGMTDKPTEAEGKEVIE